MKMLTIFTCPKPFMGHFNTIQRNAIKSWTLLKPRPEIILLGNEGGVKEICEEFDLCHIPQVDKNEFGTPLLNDIFSKSEKAAKGDILGYVNPDIILFQDFIEALKRVVNWKKRYLMIGGRQDLNVEELLDFSDLKFQEKFRQRVEKFGIRHKLPSSDYFVFPKDTFKNIPPFALGRTIYDYWLIWFARDKKIPVINTTKVVTCIHQNHDRTYTSIGKNPIDRENSFEKSEEAKRNIQLTKDDSRKTFTLYDSTHIMTKKFIFPAYYGKYLDRKIGRIGESINERYPRIYSTLKKFKINIFQQPPSSSLPF